MFEQLKYESGDTWTLLEPSITSLRMLITLAGLLFLQQYRTFQLIIALALHIFVIIYNGNVRPFRDREYGFF